jgi:rod shape-determining protein MreD
MNQEFKYYLVIFFAFGITAVVLQSLFVPIIEIGVWKPDLVLVIVLLIGKRFGATLGSTTGFILGLVQDSLTSLPVGITALPKVLAGYAAGKIKILKFEGTVLFLWFILISFLHEFIFYFILQFKMDVSFTYLVYSRIFPNTIYTSIMLSIVYWSTQKYLSEE